MQTHNYTYNFGFLAQWFAENPNISRRDVLTALGINDYKTLQNWTDGINIMPLTQILRLCNAFSIPLDCFFLDNDAQAYLSPAAPGVNAQTEPSGGWREKESKGGRHAYDPRTDKRKTSAIPANYIEQSPTPPTDIKPEPQVKVKAPDVSELSEMANMQEQMHEERLRFLDIISKQMDRITELTRQQQKQSEISIQNYHPAYASEPIIQSK